MSVQTLMQPILLSSTYTIPRLFYTYRCPTLNPAYVCEVYVQNHWVPLDLNLRHLQLGLSTESLELDYT